MLHSYRSKTHHASRIELTGSVQMLALGVLTALFVAGGCYLYSVNRSAVQGYQMRSLEKEIHQLKEANTKLQIAEADLRSLYKLEGAKEGLQMEALSEVIYIEERGSISESQGGPVALK